MMYVECMLNVCKMYVVFSTNSFISACYNGFSVCIILNIKQLIKKCRALCKKNKIYGNYKLFAPLDVGTRRAAFFEEKKTFNKTRHVASLHG